MCVCLCVRFASVLVSKVKGRFFLCLFGVGEREISWSIFISSYLKLTQVSESWSLESSVLTVIQLQYSRVAQTRTPFKIWNYKTFMFLALLQARGQTFKMTLRKWLMNPYSEIDIARGSTLIILITSSHFRMTHTHRRHFLDITNRWSHTGAHWPPTCPELAHNRTEQISSPVEINKSIGEKKTGTDRQQRRVHFYNGDLFCVNVRHGLFRGEAAMAQNQQSYSTLHDSNTTVCTNKVLINEIFTMEQV